MRRGLVFALLLAGLSGSILHAEAPLTSVRPAARPAPAADEAPRYAHFLTTEPGLKRSIRPRPRPYAITLLARQASPVAGPVSSSAVARSLRPEPRPARVASRKTASATAAPVKQPKVAALGRAGSLCGVRSIKGVRLAPIKPALPGCGVSKPVQVASVAGVALSRPAIMDCTTAKALNAWVRDDVETIIGRIGGGVKALQVAAGYSCRTRNSQPGAKISEHGRGRAIDISGFTLANGKSITVAGGWNRGVQGKILRRLHDSACGPFGTVLGPGSDRFHQDHFHLDTARYRGGNYCR